MGSRLSPHAATHAAIGTALGGVLVLIALPLAACGGSELPPGCTVRQDLGDIGAVKGAEAGQVPQQPPTPPGNPDAKLLFLKAPVSADDVFELELWDSYGSFGDNDVTTGTFAITGPETMKISCGVCVKLLGNVGSDGVPAQIYIATAGSVTISSIAGQLVGNATGLVLNEIDDASAEGAALIDGCTSAISDVSFDVVISPAASAARIRR